MLAVGSSTHGTQESSHASRQRPLMLGPTKIPKRVNPRDTTRHLPRRVSLTKPRIPPQKFAPDDARVDWRSS